MYMKTRILDHNGERVYAIVDQVGSIWCYHQHVYWLLVGGEWQKVNGLRIHRKIRAVLQRGVE